MVLERLELDSFRNYESLRADLAPGLNLLVGENAQGKTSFLEALYLLSTTRSFRATRDEEWMAWGGEDTRVEATLRRDQGSRCRLEMAWRRSGSGPARREVRRNRLPLRRLADFLGEVPLALFVPSDLGLVQGGPQERRRYLDLLLCKLYPVYLAALSRYQQALRQRNELLRRRPPAAADELVPWEEQLARSGAVVAERRRRACDLLEPRVADVHARLAGSGGRLGLAYRPAGPESEEGLRDALVARRSDEVRRGATLVGPHRDDLGLTLDGNSLRRFGSQGQQRSAALALRLGEARMLADEGGEGSVVLLDDCYSELDPGRRERLTGLLVEWPQVFVTTTSLPGDPPQGSTLLRVRAGRLEPADGRA